ncbi:MAG: SEL1-like repeat protein [Terracidiphilus sp.]
MQTSKAGTTLVVILGASEFPNAPGLTAGKNFANSAHDLNLYALDTDGLDVSPENICSFFDNEESSPKQLCKLADFLQERISTLKTAGSPANNLLVYYVGHGIFNRRDQSYCLAIRDTRVLLEGPTSLRAIDLADTIRNFASSLRNYLILDCCFAASIIKELQSTNLLEGLLAEIQDRYPSRGIAVLCSSSSSDYSFSPSSITHTMFTEALIQVLRNGKEGRSSHFSLYELSELVTDNLRSKWPMGWARPEVHSPSQGEGDVARVPLFPNPSYRPFMDSSAQNEESIESLTLDSEAQASLTVPPTKVRSHRLLTGSIFLCILISLSVLWRPTAALLGSYLYSKGNEYRYGQNGIARNYDTAEKWFERSAFVGNDSAMESLANMYYSGTELTQNYQIAREWFEKAADKGNPDAMYSLGNMYYSGVGFTQDYKEAHKWFESAASKDNSNAMKSLGDMSYSGTGIKQDYKLARKWYEYAAAKYNSDAMDILGDIYSNGVDVPQDYKKAFEWYQTSAAKGNRNAMTSLGYLYKNGNGVARDYVQASKWFESAASKGDAQAMDGLGDIYYEGGNGIARNYKEALKWYQKGADNNIAGSMYSLGQLYENGEGVRRSLDQASSWYCSALNAGYADAQEALTRISYECN